MPECDECTTAEDINSCGPADAFHAAFAAAAAAWPCCSASRSASCLAAA